MITDRYSCSVDETLPTLKAKVSTKMGASLKDPNRKRKLAQAGGRGGSGGGRFVLSICL